MSSKNLPLRSWFNIDDDSRMLDAPEPGGHSEIAFPDTLNDSTVGVLSHATDESIAILTASGGRNGTKRTGFTPVLLSDEDARALAKAILQALETPR